MEEGPKSEYLRNKNKEVIGENGKTIDDMLTHVKQNHDCKPKTASEKREDDLKVLNQVRGRMQEDALDGYSKPAKLIMKALYRTGLYTHADASKKRVQELRSCNRDLS